MNQHLSECKGDRPHQPAMLHRDISNVGGTEKFVGVLGHELRGPVAAIRNALQLLRLRGDESAVREYVEGVLDRQSQKMNNLITDMLDLARAGTGKIRLSSRLMQLEQLVDLAIETVRPLIEERRHRLTVVLPPEPVVVHADPSRLGQILTNLLTNAAKYTNPGGRIWLTIEREEDYVAMRVRDTGIGIEPDVLAHVFEPFWQSSTEDDHSKAGLGIGLALVQDFVELHGGSVTAFSAGAGQGAEFVVRLPHAPCGRASAAVEG